MNVKNKLPKSVRLKTYLLSLTLVSMIFLATVAYVASNGSFTAPNIYLDDLPSTASYVVKTDGTYTWSVRYDGKITSNSTNASAVINNAIGNLTEGGKIFIKAGMYLINALLNPVSDITIEGDGGTWLSPTTVLQGSNGLLNLTNVDNIVLKSLKLHGADGSSDIITAKGCLSVTMEDLEFVGTSGNGLYAEDCMDFILSRVYFSYVGDFENGKAGIKVRRTTGTPRYGIMCNDWYLDHLMMVGMGDRGMGIDAYDTDDTIANWRVTNCKFEGAWQDVTVKLRGGEISYTNNYITGAKKENLVLNVYDFKITGCHFGADADQGDFPNVLLESSHGELSGCTFRNTNGSAHIILSSDAVAHTVVIADSAFYSDPLKPYILNNYIYGQPSVHGLVGDLGKSENSGQATVACYEWVSHYLCGTPTVVMITVRTGTYGTPAKPVLVNWVGENSTQFQVAVFWANGTAITADAIIISWIAYWNP